MSELGLTLARLAFLAMLWGFVIATVLILRRDLRQPADARPVGQPSRRPPRQPKPSRAGKKTKVVGSKLVVVEGPLTGTVIPLSTTLVIEDDYASSRHARIYPAEGSWLVEDLGSTNGTWIDRTRITSPTLLTVGAPLRVGRTTIQMQK